MSDIPASPLELTLQRLELNAPLLGSALSAYAREMPHGPARSGLIRVAADIQSNRVATALADETSPHRDLLWSVVADQATTGKQSDFLKSVLSSARHFAQRRHRLWRAFAYPAVLLLVCQCIISFVIFYIMPQFRQMFMDFDVQLPPPTLLVLEGQYVLRAALLVMVALAIVVYLIPSRYFDYVLQFVPVVGRYRQNAALARYCRTTAALIAAGVDLPVAVEQAGRSPSRPLLRDAARRLAVDLNVEDPSHNPQVRYPIQSVVAYALSKHVPQEKRRSRAARRVSPV